MADGIRCKHCGRQETSHELVGVLGGVDLQEASERLPNRRMTLVQCVQSFGFEAPKSAQRMSRKHERFDEACLDRRARGMVAWGAWGAHCRQVKFDEELGDKENAVKRATSAEGRQLAQKAKDVFLTKARQANHVMHIGPY